RSEKACVTSKFACDPTKPSFITSVFAATLPEALWLMPTRTVIGASIVILPKSQLLTQRPDIREAEAALAAANANVENARAQMLPNITLTGEGGYQSSVLKILMRPESIFFNLGAGLTQPIFDGLRLQGNLDLQKGRQDELLQNYRKAVISGFADVENALDAIRQTALRERLQRDVVTSSQRAFDISEQRLRQGTIDLVTVLQ